MIKYEAGKDRLKVAIRDGGRTASHYCSNGRIGTSTQPDTAPEVRCEYVINYPINTEIDVPTKTRLNCIIYATEV